LVSYHQTGLSLFDEKLFSWLTAKIGRVRLQPVEDFVALM
jgi:hypothetical protein